MPTGSSDELSQSDQNNPQETSPPVAEDKLATIAERLSSLFGDPELDRSADELRLKCDVSDLVYVLKTLRDDPVLQFKQLTDLTADYPMRRLKRLSDVVFSPECADAS